MHDKTTLMPGRVQSCRDLPEDDKVKMMKPGSGLEVTYGKKLEHETMLEQALNRPHPPMDSEVRQAIHRLNVKHAEVRGEHGNLQARIIDLEAAEVLAQNQQVKLEEKISFLEMENKATKSVVAGMEEWQDRMGDTINTQTEKIAKLQELLENQMVASTDAINGLVEQVADLKKISMFLYSLIIARMPTYEEYETAMATSFHRVTLKETERAVREILERISQRQSTEPRKTGG